MLSGAVITAIVIVGYSGRLARPTADAPVGPSSALVAGLDRMIQIRFRTITEDDIRDNKLGVSRFATIVPGHGLVFRPDDSEEYRAVRRLQFTGWSTSLYVVGKRGPRTTLKGPIKDRPEAPAIEVKDDTIKQLALRAMADRAPVQGELVEPFLEARPVLASRKQCITCHRGMKVGEPIAAVVYTFTRNIAP